MTDQEFDLATFREWLEAHVGLADSAENRTRKDILAKLDELVGKEKP